MQYSVHLYPTVRIKVTGIEADSVAEAVAKAEQSVDLHDVLDNPKPAQSNVEHIGWDEGPNSFVLVDPLDQKGEVIHSESQWLDGDGSPLVDGKTPVERKAEAADAARLFMTELLESVETLTGIAEVHGPRTLADLMYLQAAILEGGFIDHYPEESAVAEIVAALPSGERWTTFIKTEYLLPRESSGA